jgi:hypothetical protein
VSRDLGFALGPAKLATSFPGKTQSAPAGANFKNK